MSCHDLVAATSNKVKIQSADDKMVVGMVKRVVAKATKDSYEYLRKLYKKTDYIRKLVLDTIIQITLVQTQN